MKKIHFSGMSAIAERFDTLKELVYSSLLPRYQLLQKREQRMVLTTMVVLPVALFLFGLWLPLIAQVHDAQKSIPALEQQYSEIQLLAKKLKRDGKRKGNQDLLTTVEQSAQVSHVRSSIVRLKPQPDLNGKKRLQIRMQSVPYQSLIYFLYKLAQAGVSLDRAKMLASAKPGILDVDLLAARSK
ncbi:MAG: type II secretion system protein GspM [Mariprofundaceae bacterium]